MENLYKEIIEQKEKEIQELKNEIENLNRENKETINYYRKEVEFLKNNK